MDKTTNWADKGQLQKLAASNKHYHAGGLHAIPAYFANYVNFTGRSDRPEFWYWTLWNFLISLILVVLPFALIIGNLASLGLIDNGSEGDVLRSLGRAIAPILVLFLFSSLWSLGTFLPGLAIGVRRFRDAGVSWIWYVVLKAGPSVLLLITYAVLFGIAADDQDNSGIILVILILFLVLFLAAIGCSIAMLVIYLLPSKPLRLADGSLVSSTGIQLEAAKETETASQMPAGSASAGAVSPAASFAGSESTAVSSQAGAANSAASSDSDSESNENSDSDR